MITIAKRFTFDAAHRLDKLPPEHKCFGMHGHTYSVEIQLQGHCDERGFIVDYQEIADAWAPLHEVLDHHLLNEIPELEVPTTEVLVVWIMRKLWRSPIGKMICAIKVCESSTTWAGITRDDFVKMYTGSDFLRSDEFMELDR